MNSVFLYLDPLCTTFLNERRSATEIILKQGEGEGERLQPATFPRSRHWHARNNVIIIIIIMVVMILMMMMMIMILLFHQNLHAHTARTMLHISLALRFNAPFN